MGVRTDAGRTPAGHGNAIRSPGARIAAACARLPAWAPLLGVGAFYMLLTLVVVQRGFLEYNADGYTRIIRGYEWLQQPRWEVGVWLPGQTWLFGVALWLHDSVRTTPRVVNLLLSLVTLVALYQIGATLAGRVAGLVTAGIAACFPWVVWFGVSGMSEPLFHATLTLGLLGFARWCAGGGGRALLLYAGGLTLATTVRYEGWFYAAVAGPLLLALAWRSGRLRPAVAVAAATPLLFPALWVQQWWQRFGEPFGFASETAEIKAALDAENAAAGLLRRLTVYPEETARLAPWLALLCLAAVVYALYRRVPWWPYIVLVGGQAALLVAVSAGYSNLGPGAERYLLSNFILCFPILGAALALLPRRALQMAGGLALLVVLTRLLPTLLDPPTTYPDADVRAAAERSADWLARYDAPLPDPLIPVLLPAAPAEGFNASYAFRILSNHPDDWFFTSDPHLFAALTTSGRAPFWVLDTSTDSPAPPAAHSEQVGRFLLGVPLGQEAVQTSAASSP